MNDFNFFVSTPEILGGTQTLVGVFITLIILCLFNGNTNFIQRIILNFGFDLSRIIDIYKEQLKEIIHNGENPSSHQEDDILSNLKYWNSVASSNLKNKLNYNRTLVQNIEMTFDMRVAYSKLIFQQINNNIKRQKEDKFIELHLLIYAILILTIDALSINSFIGAFFINLSVILSIIYDLFLIKNAHYPSNQPLKDNIDSYGKSHWYRKIKLGLLSSLSLIVWMGSWCFINNFFNWILLILIGILLFYFGNKFLKHMPVCKYNNRYVVKHVTYIISSSFLMTFIFILCINNNCIYNICPSKYVQFLNHWNDIALSFCNVQISRCLIVLYLTIVSFFLPLILGYLIRRKSAYQCFDKLQKKSEECKVKIQLLNNEYKDIINEIQKEETEKAQEGKTQPNKESTIRKSSNKKGRRHKV